MKKFILAIMIVMFGSAVAMAQFVSFLRVSAFELDKNGKQTGMYNYTRMFLCVVQHDDDGHDKKWERWGRQYDGVEYAKDRGWILFEKDLSYRKEFEGKSCEDMIQKYRDTDYIIDTENMSVEEIGKKIMEYFPKPPPRNRTSYDIVIPGVK